MDWLVNDDWDAKVLDIKTIGIIFFQLQGFSYNSSVPENLGVSPFDIDNGCTLPASWDFISGPEFPV